MILKIKKLNEDAKLPMRQKEEDAGLDFTATSCTYDNEKIIYGTGISLEIPPGHVGLMFPRSSICKYDLSLTNSVGVIDSNYRGEIKFIFKTTRDSGCKLNIYQVGDRIGQLIVIPYPTLEIVEVDELSNTERGDQGFGSSGS